MFKISKRRRIINCYVDADWMKNLNNRRFYTEYVCKYVDKYTSSAISWVARKQRIVALFSTEAEYLAFSEAIKEAIRTYKNDNQHAQKLVKNLVFYNRTSTSIFSTTSTLCVYSRSVPSSRLEDPVSQKRFQVLHAREYVTLIISMKSTSLVAIVKLLDNKTKNKVQFQSVR